MLAGRLMLVGRETLAAGRLMPDGLLMLPKLPVGRLTETGRCAEAAGRLMPDAPGRFILPR